MGLLWRLFAPRPLKKARRAMHPSWVVEDAIVRSVRGNSKRRKPPSRHPAAQAGPRPAGGGDAIDEWLAAEMLAAANAKTYRASLQFPDGSVRECCREGHPAQAAARRHGEQIAAAQGFGTQEDRRQPRDKPGRKGRDTGVGRLRGPFI